MRLTSKFNTIFFKLILSFITIITVTAITLSLSSYYYFSKNFNSKVEQVNYKMLEHLGNIISEKIVNTVDSMYADIFFNNYRNTDFIYLIENGIKDNSTRVVRAYSILEDTVNTNSDVVDSIYVYFNKYNTVLSYPEGVKYLDQSKSILLLNPEIFKQFSQSAETCQWISMSKVSTSFNSLPTLGVLYSYPPRSGQVSGKCSLLINISEDAIFKIIQQSYSEKYGHIMLLDSEGSLISHSSREMLDKYVSGELALDFVLPDGGNTGNYIKDINGIKTMVNYITITENGWRLVNLTPINEYYRESEIIQRAIIIISLATILIGFIIANIFSVKIYSPIKQLVNTTRNFSGNISENCRKAEKEYVLINEFINNMSVKVLKLENTLTSYRPLIKHTLVFDIVNGNIADRQELNNRVARIGFTPDKPWFVPLVIEMDRNIVDNLNLENNQFVKYHIISQLESYNDTGIHCIAANLSENKTYVVANLSNNNMKIIEKLSNDIITNLNDNFTLPSIVSIGEFTENPLELCQSFKETEEMLEYSFVLPDKCVITVNDTSKRIKSLEKIPDRLCDDYASFLKANDVNAIIRNLSDLTSFVLNGKYPIKHCHQVLNDYMSILSKYMMAVGYSSNQTNDRFSGYECIKNIILFKEWFIRLTEDTIRHVEVTNSQRLLRAVETAKSYIDENLALAISLESVSEKVMISPSYFSKAFKEIVGMNFVEYVNEKRMECAKKLLLSTSMTVEEIALKAGYSNSNYFIRKFKEQYGITPKYFKSNNAPL